MNLKEFDAKQFLLEKGERVALGVAVAVMVLMLIFSLFMPSNGFFSGSPAAKAEVLKKGTEQLETALRTRTPGDNDKPDKREGGMPNLDTDPLRPGNYEALAWFEPSIKESRTRRPPKILNVVEAAAEPAHVLIETYMFDQDFTKIWVLDDKNGSASPGGMANPFAAYGRGGRRDMPMPGPGMSRGGFGSNYLRQTQNRFSRGFNAGRLQGIGADDKAEYEPKLVPVDNWNERMLTARQPRPLRMAIVAGSFPYKRQVDEFRRRLRLSDINDVFSETVGKGAEQSNAFDFVSVKVQRAEVDADGKVGAWNDLPLGQAYQTWLKHTFMPFQSEDEKYDLVRFDGIAMPLLREFHANKTNDLRAMMSGQGRGGFAPRLNAATEVAADEVETKYPDPANNLPKLQETLEKLKGEKTKKIAAPKKKAEKFDFNPFKPNATLSDDKGDSRGGGRFADYGARQDSTIPDYCLMRFVDVNLQAGKRYRYRLRVRMVNPNYQREDVASPAYKKDKELESEWFEVPQTVVVPPEAYYYVADDKPAGFSTRDLRKEMPQESARYKMWALNPNTDQVVLQLHRWVEAMPISRRDDDVLPVGDWAIADRVFVSRGESIGRRVRVDLPIWKYVQNGYVLPAEEQQKTRFVRRMATTGIDVDFGQDPQGDTILVDFEGGRIRGPSKMDDACRLEVLMLSPDGKLLARNNAVDTADEDRQKRRKEALDRIKEIRQGKSR